jgi:hypothetical protein
MLWGFYLLLFCIAGMITVVLIATKEEESKDGEDY